MKYTTTSAALLCVALAAVAVLPKPRPSLADGPHKPAASADLKPALRPIGFLVGEWIAADGTAEHGAKLSGTSVIAPEVGGAVLVRRDHTAVTAADGPSRGGFDQLMTIYPESGTLHADYFDGDHTIHYTAATVVDGTSVAFATAVAAGRPTFRLTYSANGGGLAVKFEMAAPGHPADFRVVAQGELSRAGT